MKRTVLLGIVLGAALTGVPGYGAKPPQSLQRVPLSAEANVEEKFDESDLQEAHRLRNHFGIMSFEKMQESLLEARILYYRIARSPRTDPQIRREAAYYLAVCDYRLNFQAGDAIRSFQAFLKTYDNGNEAWVPEALIGLGISYQDARLFRQAGQAFAEVIRRFPTHPAAQVAEKYLKDMQQARLIGEPTERSTRAYFQELFAD